MSRLLFIPVDRDFTGPAARPSISRVRRYLAATGELDGACAISLGHSLEDNSSSVKNDFHAAADFGGGPVATRTRKNKSVSHLIRRRKLYTTAPRVRRQGERRHHPDGSPRYRPFPLGTRRMSLSKFPF
jgi:hypothetical protein